MHDLNDAEGYEDPCPARARESSRHILCCASILGSLGLVIHEFVLFSHNQVCKFPGHVFASRLDADIPPPRGQHGAAGSTTLAAMDQFHRGEGDLYAFSTLACTFGYCTLYVFSTVHQINKFWKSANI